MEKLTGFLLLNFALAQDTPTYFKDGGELTLDVRSPPPDLLRNIEWMFQGDMVAWWVKDTLALKYFKTFINRTTLDLTTGRLEINNMTKADMGVYSVTVNSKVPNERYNALMIQEVPQPEIWLRPITCFSASDTCTLTCETYPTDSGPVTYSWKKGDGGAWEESGKDLGITGTETVTVQNFTCRIKNPVSERDRRVQF